VEVGEFIIFGRAAHIEGVAIAIAKAAPNVPKPVGFPIRWHTEGWQLPIKFVPFEKRVRREELVDGLFLTGATNSPFRQQTIRKVDEEADKSGTKLVGKEIYLAKLPDADAPEFFERIRLELEIQRPGELDRALIDLSDNPAADAKSSKATTRKAIVQARLGQGQFRDSLLEMWHGRCCATGLGHKKLLRASHILAWSSSDDQQRLSPYNGLLLSAAYDAAFDAHLITLAPTGQWENVAGLTEFELEQAGLGKLEDHSVVGLEERHMEYLLKHNQNARDKWAKPT
jgi:hypothetical protein